MAIGLDHELEMEWEDEFEDEFEDEEEDEDEFGGLGGIAQGLMGALGEDEGEDEEEDEDEFLGALGNIASSLLGESEYEDEYEDEAFFGSIGKFLKKAAPFLKSVAKVAAPMVGTAMLGPLGGKLGGMVSQALGEGEFEDEFEDEYEDEFEEEDELEADIAAHEAMAEYKAMIGAATLTMIRPRDRAALRAVLPHMVRGTAILARILRRRRGTRHSVRAIPSIVGKAAKTLKRRAASGRPITRKAAARAMAGHTRRTLGSKRKMAKALTRNLVSTRRNSSANRVTRRVSMPVGRPIRRGLRHRRRGY
jgi:hypothetical protein